MRGALIKTETRAILEQGIEQGIGEAKKETAIRMLKNRKFTMEEIAEYSDLSLAEVERLAKLQMA